MNPSGNLWVVVLAGGSGSRLAPLGPGADGVHVPKQFRRFGGSASMLQRTLERARSLAPASHVLPVVLEAHRAWWEPEMARVPDENRIVQPLNRGTGFAILHALTVVLQRDPTARMLVMPSDHGVRDELVLRRAMANLVRQSQEDPDDVLLLGALPDRAETSYGLTFAASVAAVWRLYGAAQPAWLERFVWSIHGGDDPEGMLDVFGRLPHLDFGQDVLTAAADQLRVMPVAPGGWTDLGTPERVSAWITASASRPPVDQRMAQGA